MQFVIPEKAGIQKFVVWTGLVPWTPAVAGVTDTLAAMGAMTLRHAVARTFGFVVVWKRWVSSAVVSGVTRAHGYLKTGGVLWSL
jgi:hypothetical protein